MDIDKGLIRHWAMLLENNGEEGYCEGNQEVKSESTKDQLDSDRMQILKKVQ